MVELDEQQMALFLALCPAPVCVFDVASEVMLIANDAARAAYGGKLTNLTVGTVLSAADWDNLGDDPLPSQAADATIRRGPAAGGAAAVTTARIRYRSAEVLMVLTSPVLPAGGPDLQNAQSASKAHGEPAGFDAQSLDAQSLAGARVLLVDDDRNTRDMLSAVLQMYGANVAVAGSVRQALQSVADFQPTVIVSDVGMPEEDGFDLIRQVRALAALRGGNTPAIAVTGYTRAEDRAHALAMGYQAFLAKPLDLDELILHIKTVVVA